MVVFSCFIFPSEYTLSYKTSLVSILQQTVAEEIRCFVLKDTASETERLSQDIRVHFLEQDATEHGFEIPLKQIPGDYLFFIEAGDRLENGAVLHLQGIIKAYNPDLIFINYSNELEDNSYKGHLIPGDIAGEIISPEELTNNDAQKLLDGQLQPFRFIVRRSLLTGQKITIADLYNKYSVFGLTVLHAAKRVYIDTLPIYICRKILLNAKSQEEKKIHAFLSERSQSLKIMQNYGWKKRFPGLWTSFLLPIDFYETQLPKKFRRDFLKQLKSELTKDSIIVVSAYLQQDYQKRWLVRAVRCGSPLLYSLGNIFSFHKYIKKIYNYNLLFIKKCFKKAINCIKYIYMIQRDLKICMPMTHLYRCHPSVNMESCNIDVRVSAKHAPYIYADEGATLWGNFIFERGIGFIRIGRRSSIGGNTTIICTQPEGISIGAQVMISWGCTLMDSNAHSLVLEERINDAWYFEMSRKAGKIGLFKDWINVKSKPIRIDDGVWIGFNVIILGGVHIGRGAVIGAGSVVAKNIPPFTVFAGNPARFIKLAPKNSGWTSNDLYEAQRFKACREVLAAIEEILNRNIKQD